jgi:LPS sulfotransferase NodH
VSAVPSLCSLVKAVHQVYYENSCRDDAAIGRGLTDLTARYLRQVPGDIEQTGLDCAHVIYNELVENPITVVKAIYKQFGWKFTAEVRICLHLQRIVTVCVGVFCPRCSLFLVA